MNIKAFLSCAIVTALTLALAGPTPAANAQSPAAAPAASADPWPRDVSVPGAAVLVYQPQVNSWVGNKLDFRAALAIKPTGTS